VTVTEALRIVQHAPSDAEAFDVVLACGFTPLHLQTFLRARLQQRLALRSVNLVCGLFGDIAGTLEGASTMPIHSVAVPIEWSDLDPRLGYRATGSWSPAAIADMLNVTQAGLDQIGLILTRVPAHVRIAVSLPTLPFPPLFHTPSWQASEAEILLDQKVATFCSHLIARHGLSFVNARRLAEQSPPAARYDLKSDLLTGFPYTVPHADALASTLTQLLAPTPPKKGIITDLDDTLWEGIVGEVGPDGVNWDLTAHNHLHALYQKLLSSLSEQGVLIGVASKNDAAVVEKVFQRSDLLLRPDRVFPIEVHWNAKSSSVTRILQVWNIAADSVVFVDDSPMELAEVATAHPGMQCIPFPNGDYAAGMALLRELRDLCGKEKISDEDTIRLQSIRQGVQFQNVVEGGSVSESFLEQADATLTIDFCPSPGDSRALELVNKTNQFNLNGIRYTEADWVHRLEPPDAVFAVLSYEDKFGQLGKIAVIQGQRTGACLNVGAWVMSCRAFSRRIEYQCLKILFHRFHLSQIRFEFTATPRNGPIQEFFAKLSGGKPEGAFSLLREQFAANCPPLYHQVIEQGGVE
jgi:FkbH-like protein